MGWEREEYKEPFKGGEPQPGLCRSKKQKHTFVIVGVHIALRTAVKVSTGPEGPDLEGVGGWPRKRAPLFSSWFLSEAVCWVHSLFAAGAPEVAERGVTGLSPKNNMVLRH